MSLYKHIPHPHVPVNGNVASSGTTPASDAKTA